MQMHDQLATMDAQQLRAFAAELIEKVTWQDGEIAGKDRELERRQQELHRRQLKIEQLTHEMAVMRRWKFAARSEQLHGEQRHLFEEAIDADLEAIGCELRSLAPAQAREPTREVPRRAPLPAHLPRIDIRHEPERTVCGCGCELRRIGEDVSEKLD